MRFTWRESDIMNATSVNIDVVFEGGGIVIDSHASDIKGAIFIGIHGDRFNGGDFANQALQSGAVFCIVDRNAKFIPDKRIIVVEDCYQILLKLARYRRERFDGCVIGITGSAGKTTTKEMFRSALLGCEIDFYATYGNLNGQIGLPLSVCNMHGSIAVLEMGISQEGEMNLLTDIAQPHIAIICSIGDAHSANFASHAHLVKEKCAIIDGCLRYVIYSSRIKDSDLIMQKAQKHVLKTACYGSAGSALCISDIVHTECGAEWTLHASDILRDFLRDLDVQADLVKCAISEKGEHLIENSLAVIAGLICACHYIYELGAFSRERAKDCLERAVRGINQFRCIAGRGQIINVGNVHIIDESYNANPQSMIAALTRLKMIGTDKLIAILGDMAEIRGMCGYYDVLLHAIKVKVNVVYFIGEEWSKIVNDVRLLTDENIANTDDDGVIMHSDAERLIEQAMIMGISRNDINDMIGDVFNSVDDVSDEFIAEKFMARDTVMLKGSNAMKLYNLVQRMRETLERR